MSRYKVQTLTRGSEVDHRAATKVAHGVPPWQAVAQASVEVDMERARAAMYKEREARDGD